MAKTNDVHVWAVDMGTMETVIDYETTGKELLQRFRPDVSHALTNCCKASEEVGVEPIGETCDGLQFSQKLVGIESYGLFVKTYLERECSTPSDVDVEIDVTAREPTRHNDIEKGHPDFVVEFPDVDSSGSLLRTLSGETVYIEFKHKTDRPSKAQMEWMVEHAQNGDNVWIMWVDY